MVPDHGTIVSECLNISIDSWSIVYDAINICSQCMYQWCQTDFTVSSLHSICNFITHLLPNIKTGPYFPSLYSSGIWLHSDAELMSSTTSLSTNRPQGNKEYWTERKRVENNRRTRRQRGVKKKILARHAKNTHPNLDQLTQRNAEFFVVSIQQRGQMDDKRLSSDSGNKIKTGLHFSYFQIVHHRSYFMWPLHWLSDFQCCFQIFLYMGP